MVTVKNFANPPRIWFGFILLGCFFMVGKPKTSQYKNCQGAARNLTSFQREGVLFYNCGNHYACMMEFKNTSVLVTWSVEALADVQNISSICTKGSFYTKTYGELVYSSKVNKVIKQFTYSSKAAHRNVKKVSGVKEGEFVTLKTEYGINPGNKTYTTAAGGTFIVEILPSCKEGVKPWYCIRFPGCIYMYVGNNARVNQCFENNKDIDPW